MSDHVHHWKILGHETSTDERVYTEYGLKCSECGEEMYWDEVADVMNEYEKSKVEDGVIKPDRSRCKVAVAFDNLNDTGAMVHQAMVMARKSLADDNILLRSVFVGVTVEWDADQKMFIVVVHLDVALEMLREYSDARNRFISFFLAEHGIDLDKIKIF